MVERTDGEEGTKKVETGLSTADASVDVTPWQFRKNATSGG